MKTTIKTLIAPIALALGIMAGPFQSSASVLGYYPFDIGALDESGNDQNLSVTAGTMDAPAKLGGKAFQCPNANVPRALRMQNTGVNNIFNQNFPNFSFSAWVQTSVWNENRDRYLAGKAGQSGGWHLRLNNGGFILEFPGASPLRVDSAQHRNSDNNTFYNVLFTFDNGVGRIYFDGKLDSPAGTLGNTSLPGANAAHFEIGNKGNNRTASGATSWYGGIDDVVVLNETLTEGQVALINALGKLLNVSWGATYVGHAKNQIGEVYDAFVAQGSAVAGGYTWTYYAGTGAATAGTITGSVSGGNAFVVLDSATGAGMKISGLVNAIALSPSAIYTSRGGDDRSLTVTVPAALVAAGPVSVTITSTVPTVAIPAGSVDAALTVNFPRNGGNSLTIPVRGVGSGTARFQVFASTPALDAQQDAKVQVASLVGHWLSGASDYADTAAYQPAGTHDGTVFGTAANATFQADVPAGYSGNCLQLNNNVAIRIANSATSDAGYVNTFERQIAQGMTIDFWEKGYPGSWGPYLSKFGESDDGSASNQAANLGWGGKGFQIRRNSGNSHVSWTLRSTAGADDINGTIDISNTTVWRHYTAVFDGITGKRQLYVDGVLDANNNLMGDFGAMGDAALSHLVLGGKEDQVGGMGSFFTGKLYDVRVYNGALSAAELASLMTTSAAITGTLQLKAGDPDLAALTVSVPQLTLAAGDVDVTLNSDNAAVAVPVGGNGVVVHFAMGGSPVQKVLVHAVGVGTANITGTSTIAVAGSASVTVSPANGLIGQWFSGAASLAETSGFRAAGTHDGTIVGGTPGNFSYSSDVPPGFSGQSADLAGDVAIQVANSGNADGGYSPTYDNLMASQFTVSYWAKGLPADTYRPWLTKRGEDNKGWQVRRSGDQRYDCFTLRGTAGPDDPQGTINVLSSANAWHHYAAVWDGAAGTRKLYIDGVLDSGVDLVTDFAPYTLASDYHIVFGGRENNAHTGYEDISPGKFYDIRIYNTALSPQQVLAALAAPQGSVSGSVAVNVGDPDTKTITVTVPASLLVSTPVTVTLSSDAPGVATPVTAVVNFAQNGANSQTVLVHAVGVGTANISGTSGETAMSGSATVIVSGSSLLTHGLIGQWFSGAANLVETSGAHPAGTHDAVAVGDNPSNYTFSSDVPPGYEGQSVLLNGNCMFAIANSSIYDAGSRPTFDDVISQRFTVAFWAKGQAGGWEPWVAKRGEDGRGYQIRRHGDGDANWPCFTLRDMGNADPRGNIDVWSMASAWHHYVATWDGVAGTRRLYVDGVLDTGINFTTDFASSYNPAPLYHLTIGGREKGGRDGYELPFTGLMYDVRVYDQAIDTPQIQAILTPTVGVVGPQVVVANIGASDTSAMTVSLPASSVASSAVDVVLASSDPGVAIPAGLVAGSLTVHFPIGVSQQTIPIHAVAVGGAFITGSSTSVSVGGSVGVSVCQPVMIGHWFSGAADLVETSGFRPAGTHDGAVVGNGASQGFSTDVPTGFSGQSLALGGDVGVAVNNSASADGAYQNTFDELMMNGCTIAFWSKGFPGEWGPWVSKQGEGNAWQVRRVGGSPHACFTVRGTPRPDEPEGVIDLSNGSVWHHYAAVWDGRAGYRALYIDGAIDSGTLQAGGDFGPMGMQTDCHVVFGGRNNPAADYGSFCTANLYDVRIYDSALSQYAVEQLVIPPPVVVQPTLTIQPWTGNQVRISWPVAGSAGFALQKSLALPGGWGDAGLTVGVEDTENVAYAPASGDAQFYRLVK